MPAAPSPCESIASSGHKILWTGPLLLGLVVLLGSCQQRLANAEQPVPGAGEATAGKTGQPEVHPAADDALAADADDAELRRGYGVVDMRANGCVTRPNDHTFRAEGCASGILIYGPYVPVPANSEIEVSFDVKPTKKMDVYADVASQMGKQVLAGLNRVKVEAGVSQRLGYRVHVFSADVNVESRIGVEAPPGAEFEISNLTMTVR